MLVAERIMDYSPFKFLIYFCLCTGTVFFICVLLFLAVLLK